MFPKNTREAKYIGFAMGIYLHLKPEKVNKPLTGSINHGLCGPGGGMTLS